MRPRMSIRRSVRPLVRQSVGPTIPLSVLRSVCRSIGNSLFFNAQKRVFLTIEIARDCAGLKGSERKGAGKGVTREGARGRVRR